MAEAKTDGAYNIAMAEKVTLEEFVRYFLPAEGADDCIKYLAVDKGEGHPNTFYPSVDLGPVSIKRAVKDLNFQPTTLDDAMKTTLSFFDSIARGQYLEEKVSVQQSATAEEKGLLAHMKFRELGGSKDRVAAIRLYEEAAGAGDVFAKSKIIDLERSG